MAAYLSEVHQIEAELIEGDRGIFDVTVNGKVVFSKYEADRFPHHDEMGAFIQARST